MTTVGPNQLAALRAVNEARADRLRTPPTTPYAAWRLLADITATHPTLPQAVTDAVIHQLGRMVLHPGGTPEPPTGAPIDMTGWTLEEILERAA